MQTLPLITDVANTVLVLLLFAAGICPTRNFDWICHDRLTARSCQCEARCIEWLLYPLRGDEDQIRIAKPDLIIILKRMRFSDLPTIDKGSITGEIILDKASTLTVDQNCV